MRNYDTAIFDLDGTLLDTLLDLADSTNYALLLCGFPTRSTKEVRTFVGNGVANLIHLAVPAGTAPKQEAACLSHFRAHYFTNMENKTAPYPGIFALLDALDASGYQMAVVSNKFDRAVKRLCETYFGPRFPVAIGESPRVAKKPAPDTVLCALEQLNATPDRAVYIGDSDVDLLTAQNSALPCLSVSWGFRSRDFLASHGATLIVDTPAELERALLR